MSKRTLIESRELFTECNTEIRAGRQDWLDTHGPAYAKGKPYHPKTDADLRHWFRGVARTAVENGSYSPKSGLTQVEMSLMKRLHSHRPRMSWKNFCDMMAGPSWLAGVHFRKATQQQKG